VSAAVKQGSSLHDAAASALAVERLSVTQSAEAVAAPGPRGMLQPITRPVLAQLDGHEGSIHRCRCSRYIAMQTLSCTEHVSHVSQVEGNLLPVCVDLV